MRCLRCLRTPWAAARPLPKQEKTYLFKINELVDDLYNVEGYLGQGGMGAVLRVEDTSDGQLYALKYCSEGRFALRFRAKSEQ